MACLSRGHTNLIITDIDFATGTVRPVTALFIDVTDMITPPPLEPGDKIGIVTPSGRIEKGILDVAIGHFEGWGLKVVTGPNIYSAYNQFGGTDDERASDLQLMLDDAEIRAVICSRGGYGTVRIIDRIDFSRFKSYPKWVVGYSDITVLHSHIQKNFKIETLHAPMPAEFSLSGKAPVSSGSVGLLKNALFGNLSAHVHSNHPLSRPGKAEGVLTGGNLSVLYSLTGSRSAIDFCGKILFIEDVGEYIYHIDRMIVTLCRSGVMGSIGGLLVGGMTKMNDNAIPFGQTAEEIIAESVDKYEYPVCFGFPAGHQSENHPLILGREVVLHVEDSSFSLTYQ